MSPVSWARGLLALLAVASLGTVARADATAIELPQTASDFAIDDTRGTVAITYPDSDQVVFYRALWNGTSDSTPLTLGKAPISVVFKRLKDRSVFVVICRDDSRLFVIDAATLKAVGEVKLSLSRVSMVRTSLRQDDPFVYYCGGQAEFGIGSGVAQFDVAQLHDNGEMQMGRMIMGASRVYVSADGALLYTLGPGSPAGFQCYRVSRRVDPSGPVVASQVTYEHDSRGGYVPDPFGCAVGANTTIYTPDLRNVIVDLHEMVIAFAPRDAAIVTANREGNLSVWSSNTYRRVRSLELPGRENRAQSRREMVLRGGLRPSTAVVLWEPSGKYALFCEFEVVYAIPMAEFAVNEPLLGIDVAGTAQFTVGQAGNLKLIPRTAGTAITLANAPKGVTLRDGALAWTPTVDDVGLQRVSVELRHGQTQRTQEITLTVAKPYIALPFTPNMMAATPDGKRVLVCQTQQRGPRYPSRAANENSRLSVVDVDSGKTLAERQIPQTVSTVAIDAQHACVALSDSDAILIFSARDLSDIKRVFTPARIARVTSVADRVLVLEAEQGATTMLRLPGFEPIDSIAAVAGSRGAPASSQPMIGFRASRGAPVWLGDRWLLSGVEYDADVQRVLGLRSVGPLIDVSANLTGPPDSAGRSSPTSPSRWSSPAIEQQLARVQSGARGAVIYQGTSNTTVLDSIPAAVTATMRVQGANLSNPGAACLSLDFRDLLAFQVRSSQVLMLEPISMNFQAESANQVAMIECATARTLLVRFRDRLFVVPLSDPWAHGLDVPLTVRPQAGVVVLGNAIQKVALSATKSADVSFTLSRMSPGIDIDPKSGTVSLAPDVLRPQAVARIVARLARTGAPAAWSAPDDLLRYRQVASAFFRQVVGRDPSGVPVAITANVIAQDKQLQRASCDVVALMELPLGEVESQLAASQLRTPAPEPSPTAQSLDQRVANLEAKINAMQAKIDLLTELLRQRQP